MAEWRNELRDSFLQFCYAGALDTAASSADASSYVKEQSRNLIARLSRVCVYIKNLIYKFFYISNSSFVSINEHI